MWWPLISEILNLGAELCCSSCGFGIDKISVIIAIGPNYDEMKWIK